MGAGLSATVRFGIAVALLVISGCATGPVRFPPPSQVVDGAAPRIEILFTGDVQGKLEPCG